MTSHTTRNKYCPSCGRLVEKGAITCLSCGMWLPAERRKRAARVDQKSQSIGAVPHLNSSLPSKEEVMRAQKESNAINVKFIIVSVVACVVLICGAILFISHPWNPNAFSTRANAPADLSQDGFPGEISTLSGQDSANAEETADNSKNNELYTALTNIYRQIAEIKSASETLVSNLSSLMSLTTFQKTKDYQDATDIAANLKSIQSKIEQVDATGTSYESSKESLQKAIDTLKELSDELLVALKIVHVSEDLNADKAQLEKLLQNQIKPAQTMFSKAFKKIEVPLPSSS